MNIDYNNHIVFISTHTKIGTSRKKAPVTVKLNADSALSNIAAKFHQCLSPIVNKLLTGDTNQNLGKVP